MRDSIWELEEGEREVESNGCAKKNKRLSLYIFFPAPKTDTKRKNQEKEILSRSLGLSVSPLPPKPRKKKRKTNLATGKVGDGRLTRKFSIQFTTSQQITVYLQPALCNSYQRRQRKTKKGK
jgi:hypothetical protein